MGKLERDMPIIQKSVGKALSKSTWYHRIFGTVSQFENALVIGMTKDLSFDSDFRGSTLQEYWSRQHSCSTAAAQKLHGRTDMLMGTLRRAGRATGTTDEFANQVLPSSLYTFH